MCDEKLLLLQASWLYSWFFFTIAFFHLLLCLWSLPYPYSFLSLPIPTPRRRSDSPQAQSAFPGCPNLRHEPYYQGSNLLLFFHCYSQTPAIESFAFLSQPGSISMNARHGSTLRRRMET